MNNTPSGERVHIGFFGRRNVGKSRLLNAVTGQDFAVVSDVAGTTTDIVRKSMELLPIGAVMIVDTPGVDDSGALGELRVKQARKALRQVDAAVLVVDSTVGLTAVERDLITAFESLNVPYIVAWNKSDLNASTVGGGAAVSLSVSAATGFGVEDLKNALGKLVAVDDMKLKLAGDLVSPGDIAVLITPIDSAAPKGRLILPQQQVLRDLLEADASVVVTKENAMKETLSKLVVKPALVVTDSQAFEKAAADVPRDVSLTSFSILMARYKGFLDASVKGLSAVDGLKDGDVVLVCEGCTHHRQCDDIGTVKLPRWIRRHSGKDVQFEFASGTGFPEDIEKYALTVHCGGCMLTRREIKRRLNGLGDAPVTNYGVLIAYMNGILERVLEPIVSKLS